MQHHHVDEYLWVHELGVLPWEEHQNIQQHLASCQRCTAHLADARESLAALANGLTPQHPPAWLRSNLQNSIKEIHRFTDILPMLSLFFHVNQKDIEKLLDSINQTEIWHATTVPGLLYLPQEVIVQAQLLSTAAGYALNMLDANTDTNSNKKGLALVLQGCCQNTYGQQFGSGHTLKVESQQPLFWVLQGPPFIYLFLEDKGNNESYTKI